MCGVIVSITRWARVVKTLTHYQRERTNLVTSVFICQSHEALDATVTVPVSSFIADKAYFVS